MIGYKNVMLRAAGTGGVQFAIQTVARNTGGLKAIRCKGAGTPQNMAMTAAVGAAIDAFATPYKPDFLQGDIPSALTGALAGEMFAYIMDGGTIDATFFKFLQASPQCILTAAAADYIAVNYVVPYAYQMLM